MYSLDNEEKIRLMLSQWFVDQNLPGMSPETTAEVAKLCLLLDVAQVFLGYDDDEMALVDSELRDLCDKFIADLKKIKEENNARCEDLSRRRTSR